MFSTNSERISCFQKYLCTVFYEVSSKVLARIFKENYYPENSRDKVFLRVRKSLASAFFLHHFSGITENSGQTVSTIQLFAPIKRYFSGLFLL